MLETEDEAIGLQRTLVMELGKSMESMVKRVSGQIGRRLDKIDLESMLASIGLQVFKQRSSLAWPLVTAFGAGMVVGAVFTPMSGKELRGHIADLYEKGRAKMGSRELTADGKPVASPYEDAKTERDESAHNPPRGMRRVQVQAGEPGPHLSAPT